MTKAKIHTFHIKGDGQTDLREALAAILGGDAGDLSGIGEAIQKMVRESGGGRRKKAAFRVMKNTSSYVEAGGDTFLRFPVGLVRDAVDYVDHKNGLLEHTVNRLQELTSAALGLENEQLPAAFEEAGGFDGILDRVRGERTGHEEENNGLAEMVATQQGTIDRLQVEVDSLTNDLTRERHLHAQARGLLEEGAPAAEEGSEFFRNWHQKYDAYQSDAATLAVAPATLDEQRPTAESIDAWIRQVKAGGLLLSRSQMLQVLQYAQAWVDRDPNAPTPAEEQDREELAAHQVAVNA